MNTTVDPVRTAHLLGELQDLKRLQPAHLPHSLATELFRTAWIALLQGEDPHGVGWRTTTTAVLYILFPGADGRFFHTAGLSQDEISVVLRRALKRVAGTTTSEATYSRLEAGIESLAAAYAKPPEQETQFDLPQPLEVLCRQPRAGATHPTLPRLVLHPAEMHSDHCLMTAVYAVLTAEDYGANAGVAFECALAHHLHNAYLPDCGYAGEICLGDHLDDAISRCRTAALRAFPERLRPRIQRALQHHEQIESPEGRAVSTGDVLDRVIDVKWRTRAAAVTDQDILGELDLVHPGPLKDFQVDLLQRTGVWTFH